MKDSNELLARLAALDPVPGDTVAPARVGEHLRIRIAASSHAGRLSWLTRPRRTLLAALAATAIVVPAAAFAGDIRELLRFSNPGVPVATSDVPLSRISKLSEAIADLHFPSELQLLGERNGVSFYAAQKADGTFCFAVDSAPVDSTSPAGGVGKAVGCAPPGSFPSPEHPILNFAPWSEAAATAGGRPHVPTLAGFAADGVARVELVDASGATIASAPVRDNLYAATGLPQVTPDAVVALDRHGNVLYRRPLHAPAAPTP